MMKLNYRSKITRSITNKAEKNNYKQLKNVCNDYKNRIRDIDNLLTAISYSIKYR
jgi:hypothetical protein